MDKISAGSRLPDKIIWKNVKYFERTNVRIDRNIFGTQRLRNR